MFCHRPIDANVQIREAGFERFSQGEGGQLSSSPVSLNLTAMTSHAPLTVNLTYPASTQPTLAVHTSTQFAPIYLGVPSSFEGFVDVSTFSSFAEVWKDGRVHSQARADDDGVGTSVGWAQGFHREKVPLVRFFEPTSHPIASKSNTISPSPITIANPDVMGEDNVEEQNKHDDDATAAWSVWNHIHISTSSARAVVNLMSEENPSSQVAEAMGLTANGCVVPAP